MARSGRKVTVRFGPGDRESCRSLSVERSDVFRLDPRIEPIAEAVERALIFHCKALGCYEFRKPSRSALIVSAWVVIIPWGKSL